MKCPKCQVENPETSLFCSGCGAKLDAARELSLFQTATLQTPLKELTTGTTFAGRYQIIEELGKGGMGKVYKVFDTKIEEKIALKLIKPEIASDRQTIERFSNELKLARKIAHRNICRMFDLGEAEGTHFITMEYVPGENLKSTIRRIGQLPVVKSIAIARQICEGLAEAHRLGVVHRDLKPSNIILDSEGNARIMDFGIARSLTGKGITDSGVMIGTPEYMSPEQVEGKEVDQRSDIYSLGIILFEMLAGCTPFSGDTPLSVAVKQKTEAPPDPRRLNPQIPADLSRLILKCLEKNKSERYQSSEELRSDLEKAEKGIPATERIAADKKSPTSREITVKFSLRKLLFPYLAVIALVIAAGIILWRTVPRKGVIPAKSVPPSIAVLPFMDDSPEKGYAYLCEGIPNTLINALTTVQSLRVPARTSSFSFAGKGLDIRAIGQKLNVENVLEGSIQVVGSSLRVTTSLVKANDGYPLWNATYDRRLEDVFAIQDEIAQAIVRALKMKLLDEQEERLVRRDTESMEAYTLYLEGLYHWNRRTGRDLNRAIALFNQAIDNDPDYAMAYVGLADSYNLLSQYGDARPKDSFPRARAAAAKALEINETLAEAHTSLGYVYERHDWNWKAAETEFKRALELNPNYATGHFWYGELLAYFGRFEESIREMKRALELDPVSLVISTNLGWVYLMAGQLDQALAQLHKALEMDPHFAAARLTLGFVHLNLENFPEAINEMKGARELSGDTVLAVSSLGYVYAEAKMLEEAGGILEELKARALRQYVSPYRLAVIYTAMNDSDKAFELAEKAYEEKDEYLVFMKIEPNWVPFHSDPRYQALLKKLGLG
ncbi:MAG: protein kinase [Candidatus Aminicenantales bacterium]